MPIYREHHASQGRDCDETGDYLLDKKHAGPGEMVGPKVDFYGQVNGLSDDFESTRTEMLALKACYQGDGEAFSHVSFSLREGEKFTPAQAQEAVKIYLKHQGMEGHLALWSVHKDTTHHHIHIMTCRIKPEPNATGTYEIKYTGGSVTNPTSGHNLSKLCGHAAEAEIRATQGWAREKKAKYDMVDGQLIKASYKKDPADADKIKLGSRVEAYEAHNNTVHPKRVLAEQAVQEIRASNSDKAIAIQRLAAIGITYVETEKGGKLTSDVVKKGIKLSSLPKDCRFLFQKNNDVPENTPNIPTKIDTYSDAKRYIKQAVKDSSTEQIFHQKLTEKGLVFEQTGKSGARIRFGSSLTDTVKLSDCGTSFLKLQQKFLSQDNSIGKIPHYAPIMHDGQGKVNALFEEVHGNGGQYATNIHEKSFAEISREILAAGKTETETHKALQDNGITMTKETATDKKTGNTYTYGKLSRPGEKDITLRALGLDANGKPLFSLAKLDQQFLKADATPILSAYAAQGRTATAAALQDAGIALVEVKKMGDDGKEYRYGQLERNGVTVSLGALGKTDDGKAIYSLGMMEKREREIRQGELRNDAQSFLTAYAAKGRTATTFALAAQGIALVEVKKTGEDGKEYTYGQLERDGITVSLSSFGKTEDGKSLYSLGGLEKAEREHRQNDLRSEAMPIILAQKGWDDSVKVLADKGIKLSEEPLVIKDKDSGQEKEIIVARIERDGISVSLKSLVDTDGKPLFRAREMQRQQLATDAAAIVDAHSSYSSMEGALTQASISYRRVKSTVIGKDGEEKTVTLGRIERDGIVTTLGHAGKEYGINALDERYMPRDTAASLYREARTQAQPVQFLAAKGLTASDIDRVGRVGERMEKSLQRKERPDAAPQVHVQAPVGKNIIPTNINEILDLISESAAQAASLAQANAKAAQAIILANRANAKAEKAEQALAELKASIKHEQKPTAKPAVENKQPTPQESKGADMADNNTAPTSPTPTPEKPDHELTLAERVAKAKAAGAFDNHSSQPLTTINSNNQPGTPQNQQHHLKQ